MSLKLKALIAEKNYTQKELADSIYVSDKTVRNWVKENGNIPDLDKVKSIADTLKVPTSEVYDCFINDPDNKYSSILESLQRKRTFQLDYSSSQSLFHYIEKSLLFGKGFFQYETYVFYFDHVLLNERKYPGNDIDENIKYLVFKFYGLLLFDNYLNFIPITAENIINCKELSSEYGNKSFEISFTKPLIPEMQNKSIYTANLTFLDFENRENRVPFYDVFSDKFAKIDQEQIIGSYIKHIRTKYNVLQSEFSDTLSLILEKKIKKDTISKWENNQLIPTLHQLQAIGIQYGVSIKEMLNSYDTGIYAPNSIYNNSKVFNIGINHDFYETFCIDDLWKFVTSFRFISNTFFKESHIPLCFIYFDKEIDALQTDCIYVFDYKNDATNLTIMLENKETIELEKKRFTMLEAYSLHNNYYYEFYGEYNSADNKIIQFGLIFSFYLTSPTA